MTRPVPGTPRRLTRAATAIGRRLAAGGRDGGYVSFWVVTITIGVLAMAGLVIDGGNALTAREQAADSAQQAARAGADALSPASLRTSASPGASEATARQAADQVLADSGLTGAIIVTDQQVTVTVVVHKATAILSAVGLSSISGTASATAAPLRGTNTGAAG